MWRSSGMFMAGTVLVGASLALAACGSDPQPEVADALPTEPGGWVSFDPQPISLDGEELEPTCSGVDGSDPTFSFWSRRGASDNIVVFFQGGGACWDDVTCSLPIINGVEETAGGLFKSDIQDGDDPSSLGGIFDLDNPDNPVRDWSFVYVPYCTGDVHGGSATAEYTNPQSGESYQVEHRGSDNTRVVLEWASQNFDDPTQVMVAGSSAGAYGAVINYPVVADTWPSATATLMADAGQGVMTPEFDTARNENWDVQVSSDVYGEDPQQVPTEEWVWRLAEAYPDETILQYTTALDGVQALFYDVMRNGIPPQDPQACEEWVQPMLEGLEVNQEQENFASYLADGDTHTLLRGTFRAEGPDQFYAERSAGVPFSDWLATALSDPDEVTSVACTDCTTCPTP